MEDRDTNNKQGGEQMARQKDSQKAKTMKPVPHVLPESPIAGTPVAVRRCILKIATCSYQSQVSEALVVDNIMLPGSVKVMDKNEKKEFSVLQASVSFKANLKVPEDKRCERGRKRILVLIRDGRDSMRAHFESSLLQLVSQPLEQVLPLVSQPLEQVLPLVSQPLEQVLPLVSQPLEQVLPLVSQPLEQVLQLVSQPLEQMLQLVSQPLEQVSYSLAHSFSLARQRECQSCRHQKNPIFVESVGGGILRALGARCCVPSDRLAGWPRANAGNTLKVISHFTSRIVVALYKFFKQVLLPLFTWHC
ncbi:hypothetical protein C0Q70_03017 [Pomacea canaliculata]|uniref:Uncharacterized protein n=1 Tax=Pomacea canaliculata TaxID=400727 RepID=A0A2T7PRP5_POMCA|nr:hypothetical protein C0Q70_03017 [Pomacea canaliculata]